MPLYRKLIFFLFAQSSIVFLEPAPYDYIIVLCILLAVIWKMTSFSKQTLVPFLLLLVFLNSNLILIALNDLYLESALKYYLITVYLTISWLLFVGILQQNSRKMLTAILGGYLIAALIADLLGILAYLGLLPSFSNVLLQFGRVTGTFKDPNVFGPFLILPALYSLRKFEFKKSLRIKVFWIISFILLTVGVLLSFSRAAWGNYCISLGIYLILLGRVKAGKRLVTMMVLSALSVIAAILIMYSPDTTDFLFSRLSIQAYDADRFSIQSLAFKQLMTQPLGIGPGQSELIFNYSTHSLYVRAFIESGFIGGIAFLLFLVITVQKAISNCFTFTTSQSHFVFTAALIGVLFNSLFIDTLHWRHFWVLLALPWSPVLREIQIEKEKDRSP